MNQREKLKEILNRGVQSEPVFQGKYNEHEGSF